MKGATSTTYGNLQSQLKLFPLHTKIDLLVICLGLQLVHLSLTGYKGGPRGEKK